MKFNIIFIENKIKILKETNNNHYGVKNILNINSINSLFLLEDKNIFIKISSGNERINFRN